MARQGEKAMTMIQFDKIDIKITDLLQGDINLASPPEIYARLSKLIEESDSTSAMLAEVIERDPAIAARLLRLANSAFFALPVKVYNIADAITLIGRQATRDLVLATEVLLHFNNIPRDLIDIYSYWRVSLRCAILSRQLNTLLPDKYSDESMFLAGLLHDIGHLVVYTRTPELGRKALLEHRHRGIPIHKVEREIMGFDYAEVGSALALMWELPEMLCSVLAGHINPQQAQEHRTEAALVHLASVISHQGSFDEELLDALLPADLPVWKIAGIDIKQLKSILPAAQDDYEAALSLLQ
jgi:HD-like signal output (HDOD) protein